MFQKKLLPSSRFLLKARCTGRLGTGVDAPTTPVLLPFWLFHLPFCKKSRWGGWGIQEKVVSL